MRMMMVMMMVRMLTINMTIKTVMKLTMTTKRIVMMTMNIFSLVQLSLIRQLRVFVMLMRMAMESLPTVIPLSYLIAMEMIGIQVQSSSCLIQQEQSLIVMH